jgi:hypothetical protein
MLKKTVWIGILTVVLAACVGHTGNSAYQDILRTVTSGSLTQTDIIAGLKQALEIGTSNAVQWTSRTDGYNKNRLIRIPLPEKVQKTEKLLRMAGMGAQVDAFELSMNRAAERAAPEAKALFVQTIKQMTFADARQILNGRENEATLYFKDKTYQSLSQRFKPLVHTAMAEVGVTNYYQRMTAGLSGLAVGDSLDLDRYVTGKALDGLFIMLAQEEAKIRNDPAARVTDLLKHVFGGSRQPA